MWVRTATWGDRRVVFLIPNRRVVAILSESLQTRNFLVVDCSSIKRGTHSLSKKKKKGKSRKSIMEA